MFKNLTVDAKVLFKTLSPAQRANFLFRQENEAWLKALSPSEYAELFPDYLDRNKKASSAVSGGTTVGKGEWKPQKSFIPTNREYEGIPGRGGTREGPTPGVKMVPAIQRKMNEKLKALGVAPSSEGNKSFSGRKAGAVDRRMFADEMKDPETRMLFATMLQAEVGGYKEVDHIGFAETVFNRAYQEGKSVKKILSSGRYSRRGYYQPYWDGRFSKAQRTLSNNQNIADRNLAVIDRVLYEGLNTTEGATDNASAGVAASVRRGGYDAIISSIRQPGRETFYTKYYHKKTLPLLQEDDPTSVPKGDGSKTGQVGIQGFRRGLKDENELPPSVRNLRVKGTDGRTRTLAEMGIGRFDQLEEMGGQAFVGGHNDRDTTLLAAEFQELLGNNFDRLTGQNDLYHKERRAPGTSHRTGRKLDFTVKGMKYPEAHKIIADHLSSKYGMEEGKHFKIISTPHGDGPHLDFELTTLGKNLYTEYRARDSSTTPTEPITPPEGYEKLPEIFKSQIENLPADNKRIAYQSIRLLLENGATVEDFDEMAKLAAKASAAAPKIEAVLSTLPPDQLPSKVNPEGFGVGKVLGEKRYGEKEQKERPHFSTGKISFVGFGDDELSSATFQAGSGGTKASVPYGTFSLTPQRTGGEITRYYNQHGMSTSGEFGTVYNVGLPGSPTFAGFDPKLRRNRTEIQIHSNVTNDVNRLISSGCLTVGRDEYPRLIQNLERARAIAGKISLVVEPGENGQARFTIVPSTLATNSIPVSEAIENVKRTGNVSGAQTEVPEIPEIAQSSGYTNSPSDIPNRGEKHGKVEAGQTPAPKTTGSTNIGAFRKTGPAPESAPAPPATPATKTPEVEVVPDKSKTSSTTTPAEPPKKYPSPIAKAVAESKKVKGMATGSEGTHGIPKDDLVITDKRTGMPVAEVKKNEKLVMGEGKIAVAPDQRDTTFLHKILDDQNHPRNRNNNQTTEAQEEIRPEFRSSMAGGTISPGQVGHKEANDKFRSQYPTISVPPSVQSAYVQTLQTTNSGSKNGSSVGKPLSSLDPFAKLV